MKIITFVVFTFLISIISTGCSSSSTKVEDNTMPEAIPEIFQFHIKYGIGMKNEINTFNGEVVKDLVVNGTHKTTDIIFTDEEMKSIYKMFRDTKPFSAKDLAKSNSCEQTPYSEFYIKLTVENHSTDFHFSEQNCELTEDGQRFKTLIYNIHDILKEKESYKNLPPAEGGYD